MPFYLKSSNKILKTEDGVIYFTANGQGKEYVVKIDEYNKHILDKTWSVTFNKSGTVKSVRCRSKGKEFKLHRIIMLVTDSKLKIDHIDGNPLNNTKTNLRVCSTAQNAKNTSLRRNSSTKFKGVSLIKSTNLFRAYITVDYKSIHLGCFKTSQEAAIAYNEAAVIYHGEFAKLNEVSFDTR